MMSENTSSPILSSARDTDHQTTPMADIEMSVSRLLMTTKRLLEILTAWSARQVKDTQVYDEYNALEFHFAKATQAFESASLSMEDMLHLPDNLFECLRDTLSKEPSSSTLEQHLPAIRDTILNLLQGLKKKQSQLRERLEPANSKLLSRAHLQPLSPLRTSSLTTMPLPSPSSSTEPLTRVHHRISIPQSPISPATTSSGEIDINDPSTKNALDALKLQENLARRSSVRRLTHNHSTQLEAPSIMPSKEKRIIDLYLKKGDRVKKTTINQDSISFPGLYQLFSHIFSIPVSTQNSYINILDPVSNIEYELENMDDVQPYSMLSIKDFNAPQPSLLPVDDDITLEMRALFEDTIQKVLNKLTQKSTNLSQDNIKEQQKELESLRHDLKMMERVYQDFKKETTQIIDGLREKGQKVTDSKSTTVIILDEKARTEISESREVTQAAATMITSRLETLQDTIDQLKLDVTQRRCRPSKNQLKYCEDGSNLLQVEMKDLQSLIKKFKPVWKKTWEAELQQIVKEQQFLKEQEALLVDLKDDHKAVLEVLEQLMKISEIQERKKQLGVEFRVAPAEEGFEGMTSVMKQVSTIHVDHHRRVKAIAQAEKSRSKELSQRIDAFERELTNFVGLRKLKKTGGAEAIEKQRREKDKALMKQIFVDSTVDSSNGTQNAPENPSHGHADDETPHGLVEPSSDLITPIQEESQSQREKHLSGKSSPSALCSSGEKEKNQDV